jgi:LmbE family N-acetylglucosaminyl deacetylase
MTTGTACAGVRAVPTLSLPRRPAFVSPHLDDAVFGCGQLLAACPGATVVTLFAGVPPVADPTDWDRRAGFSDGLQAMRSRREEDGIALGRLKALPVWLDFLDSQYAPAQRPPPDEVALSLQQVLQQAAPDALFFPLGLFHADHLLAHEAAVHSALAVPGVPRYAYEDCLYRGIDGLLQQRLMALAQEGVCLTPARFARTGPAELKAEAVRAYASQLRAFGESGLDDVAAPERCWRFEPGGPSR